MIIDDYSGGIGVGSGERGYFRGESRRNTVMGIENFIHREVVVRVLALFFWHRMDLSQYHDQI